MKKKLLSKISNFEKSKFEKIEIVKGGNMLDATSHTTNLSTGESFPNDID